MFIMPEVLWSPIVKFWISWYQPTVQGHYQVWRQNFLDNYGNSGLWSHILLVQFFGLFLTTIYLLVVRKTFKNKILFWTAFCLFSFAAVFVFYIHGFSTINFGSLP